MAKSIGKDLLGLFTFQNVLIALELVQERDKRLHEVRALVLEFGPVQKVYLGVAKGMVVAACLHVLEKGLILRTDRTPIHVHIFATNLLSLLVRAHQLLNQPLSYIPWILNLKNIKIKTKSEQKHILHSRRGNPCRGCACIGLTL